jgi:hypothetical protein
MPQRIFNYEQASAALETVRVRTQAASERLETLRSQTREHASEQDGEIARRMDEVVTQWAGDIMALGALPKGVFTVDFDSGRGFYFCWALNEPDLTHYHEYDEGFAGRKPLTGAQIGTGSVVLN